MSTSLTTIQAALNKKLRAFMTATTAIQTTNVAWPGRQFSRTVGKAWLRPTLLPAIPSQIALGAGGGVNRQRGVYQVSCFFPKGSGTTVALRYADSLAASCKAGTNTTHGSVTVRVEKVYMNSLVEEEIWLHVPVVLQYWADVSNT